MTAIDGNGETEIIAAFIVISEEEHMIRQMTQLFKDKNPKWTDIKVVLTDKDMVERTVFSEEIPNSELLVQKRSKTPTMRISSLHSCTV